MVAPTPFSDTERASPIPSEPDAFDELFQGHDSTSNARKDSIELGLPTLLTVNKARTIPGKIGSKRIRDDYPTNSSDTPFFSSDDVSASIENYDQQRRKRQHRGNWWDEHSKNLHKGPTPKSRREKREFKRTVDSAVWMGSDEIDPEDMDVEAVFYTVHKESKYLHPEEEDSLRDTKSWAVPISPFLQEPPRDLEHFQNAQREASMKMQKCAEEGTEAIDLNGLHLGEVLGTTLRPLRVMTLQTPRDLPPSQEAYQPLTPSIRLYLGNNNLTHLPGELYRLQDLTELSLRQNDLKEIMPTISRLKNLKVLNLSSNMLRWLPWELLQLSINEPPTLRVHPNPFIEPISSRGDHHLFDVQFAQGNDDSVHIVATTKVAYLDISGARCRGSPPAPSSEIEYHPSREKKQFAGPWLEERPGRVPSLFEIALRRCSESPILEKLLFSLPADSPPPTLHLLQHARAVKEAGGKECSVCGQNYIVPRTEWIEWWIWDSAGMLPFLRRGCSWDCTANLDAVHPSWRDCGWKSPA